MLGLRRVCWPAVAAIAAILAVAPAGAQASAVPFGFTESAAISGLTAPTTVRFSPAGHVVVAEKSGVIKEYDSLSDTTPTVIADLSNEVHDFWDRGLLGLALDPGFDTNGKLYALYTYNKQPGNNTVPRWPLTSCPDPPGANGSGCVVSGRLSLIDNGVETPLITDWCQQFPSHSIGSLVWGSDGKLYLSAGEGANFNTADDGQFGNPCGDPSHEGGALRSQDLRTTGDTLGLSGTIVRLNPSQPAQREIVAYGLRNPFRITVRPGTNEVWAGDVGWNTSEEIDRLASPNAAAPVNFGWPCFEGPNPMPAYQALGDSLCQSLPSAAGPYWDYAHWEHVDPLDTCPTGGSSISGLAFYPAGGSFGAAYQGALFFADYTRNCIWVMQQGANGLPDPATRKVFVTAAAGPVDLQIGPDGDLFYVDMIGGTIRRIRGSASVQAPTARATADKTSGPAPLTVHFDGSTSSDPRGEALTYAWDFGDGGHSTASSPTHPYATGVYTAQLTVTDMSGHSDTTSLRIAAGTPPKVPSITAPAPGRTWAVGDTIRFSGTGQDALGHPASLSWQVNLVHCNRTSGSCHTHPLEMLTGSSGSLTAPDHEYPSHLELQLTATDGDGLSSTATLPLYPKTVPITLGSEPAGVALTLGAETLTAPFTLDLIQGSRLSITAPAQATLGATSYAFSSWSDSGARSHEIVGGASPAAYTARFAAQSAAPRLTVTPSSLSFIAIAGSSNPAPKKLTVIGPDIHAAGRASWLSVARAGSIVTVAAKTAGLKRGTYHSTVEVSSPGLTPVDVPVNLRVKPHTTGLVGAWGFDETRGRTARDTSHPRNPGRISGAARTNGRHGGALSFDGINDRVTVADAKSLDLKHMTLEAWVRPRRGGSQGAVLRKGRAYGLFGGRRLTARVFTTADRALHGPELRRNAWSHVAITWDGAVRRLYVDGKQVASAALTGSAAKSAGPLRIGGVGGEWFRGRIDDVRVYNRALSAAEIALDRDTPVS